MNLYPYPYSRWCSCENRHSYTSTHFCDVAKKLLLGTILYDSHTRAAPKNHPKKVPKKAFRRARISDCYIQLHFVKSTKFLFVVTTRDSGEAKWRMCTTQISDWFRELHLFKKSRKFKKNVKMLELPRDSHTRCRQRVVPEVGKLAVLYTNLCFLQIRKRSHSRPAARRRFPLATQQASREGSSGVSRG